MKKQALLLGLTAVLYAFVFSWVRVQVTVALNFAVPNVVLTLVMLAASYIVALKAAAMFEGPDEPPSSLTVLLLFGAGFYLFVQVLEAFGIQFGFGRFGRFAAGLERWSLIGSALLVTRFVSHRAMLFVGILVMALQFQAALALGLLGINIPEWIRDLVSLVVAVLIARSFCVGDESPADRVKNPMVLWAFAATAVFAMLCGSGMVFRSWLVLLAWAAFLVSFVMLASSIEPDDPTHARSALGAGYGQQFLVLVGTFTLVSGVFHINDIVGIRMLFLGSESWARWGPMLVTLAVSIGILAWLQAGYRVREHGPGRTGLVWGVVLYFIALFAGGSLFGAASSASKPFDFLAALLIAALLVAPLMVVAQILMGVGLLRILFTLDAPRRD
jgi:hypothetical protein